MGNQTCKCLQMEQEVQTKVQIEQLKNNPINSSPKPNEEAKQKDCSVNSAEFQVSNKENSPKQGFNIAAAPGISPQFVNKNKGSLLQNPSSKINDTEWKDNQLFLKGTFGPGD